MSINAKKLDKAKKLYDAEIEALQLELVSFIQFPFFIMYQYSDGFVIVHEDECHNAPLRLCLKIINETGSLTFEDYIKICI